MQTKIKLFTIVILLCQSCFNISQAYSFHNHLFYNEQTDETYYAVQKGDSLQKIAKEYLKYLGIYENMIQVNDYVSLMVSKNEIENPNIIISQQSIILPKPSFEINRLKYSFLISFLIKNTTNIDEYEKRITASLNNLNNKNDQLLNRISSLEIELIQEKGEYKKLNDLPSISGEEINGISSSIQLLSAKLTEFNIQIQSTSYYLPFLVIVILLFTIIITFYSLFYFKRMYFKQNEMFKEQNHTIQKVSSDIQKTYDSVVEMISDTMKSLQNSLSQPGEEEREINHSLPIRVGEEIHRMRKRLEIMPDDTKGLDALKKAVDRLEDELNNQGYEIYDLLGKPFVDGLTVYARFIPSDKLKIGESIISKVIIPQINYNNVLIKVSEVEVSTGG